MKERGCLFTEKSLIRPENLVMHEHLEIDGVDVSGHWDTFITSRAVTDYNEQMEEEIAALPGGESSTAAGSAVPAPIRARSTPSIPTSTCATGSI